MKSIEQVGKSPITITQETVEKGNFGKVLFQRALFL